MMTEIHILLVEDNPGDTDLIDEMLGAAQAEYYIKHAEALADARTCIETEAFDVVLLDLGLPDTRGLDTIRNMLPAAGPVPIIVMTGLDDDQIGVAAVQEGAQDYLVKGQFDGPALMREIRYAIERKRVETELINARKWESIARLAGGIAHDFNNLHTIIAGYIELAKDQIPPEHPAFKHLEESEAACRSAKSLTRQFIEFTKKSGKHMKSQNIQAGLKSLAQPGTQESRMPEVVFDIVPELWPVACDWDQLQHALQNLLDNAQEAMPEGGYLNISAENLVLTGSNYGLPPGKYVGIQIADTGHGIAKEDQPMVFEPYFSIKERGSAKGMGLGLTIAQAIINGHDGRIRIESEEGKGTTVYVYLPAMG